MNDELKDALRMQGPRTIGAIKRFEHDKKELEKFDANTRGKIRGDGVKRTESDVDAMILLEPGRDVLADAFADSKANLEGAKADIQCILAEVSLVCSETAAMSRIAQ